MCFPKMFMRNLWGDNCIDPKWSPVQRGGWCHRFHLPCTDCSCVLREGCWAGSCCNFCPWYCGPFFFETLRVVKKLGRSPIRDQWNVKGGSYLSLRFNLVVDHVEASKGSSFPIKTRSFNGSRSLVTVPVRDLPDKTAEPKGRQLP